MSEEVPNVEGISEEIVVVKDDFGSAFEEAAGHIDAEVKPAEAPAKERAENFPKEEVTTDKPIEEQKSIVEGPSTPEPEPKPDYKKLLEEEQHKRTTLEGMYNKTVTELDTLKKVPIAVAEKPPEDNLDEEFMKDEEIKGFLEEYDYLAKPIQKIVARAIERATSKAIKAYDETLTKEKLGPVTELTETLQSAMQHQGSINKAHPDFASLRDSGALREFVEIAPEADKAELQRIYADGSTAEVIKLVDKFKEAKKASSEASDNGDGGRAKEKRNKLANLTAVTTGKRPLNTDSKAKPETFEDAFDQAASSK